MDTTLFIGRLLGLYLVAVSLAMLANRRATLATLVEMAASGPWMLFAGMVATALGFAILLTHNVWTGGALTVAVTLSGWAALIKGLVLLFVPPPKISASYRTLGLERYYYVWFGAVLAFGVCLTAAAFSH